MVADVGVTMVTVTVVVEAEDSANEVSNTLSKFASLSFLNRKMS